ncbi:MAG: cytochrome c biogenesis protein CcsA [Thermodesulfobacteriota bacterium]
MEQLVPLSAFASSGRIVMGLLLAVAVAAAVIGLVQLLRGKPVGRHSSQLVLAGAGLLYLAGFVLICWFHYRINRLLPLELPPVLADYLNRQLAAMNQGAAYGLPLYDSGAPPRYSIPVWIENEKYFFWFLCYSLLAMAAHRRLELPRFRGVLLIGLAVQTAILFFAADPFAEPLPRFFKEITPWFADGIGNMERLGMFMQLYPRMIFYYNAEYMWLHPPLLFLSYAAITLTFFTSLFMLVRRELVIEQLGYDYAKLGFFLLTLGMLLGYPWALKAWGPNWWWDPKICSSIMMWAVYSTYLHTRLYANKKGMWYFSSALGILCFAAMIFTFLASFFFPGEHTFQ